MEKNEIKYPTPSHTLFSSFLKIYLLRKGYAPKLPNIQGVSCDPLVMILMIFRGGTLHGGFSAHLGNYMILLF